MKYGQHEWEIKSDVYELKERKRKGYREKLWWD